MDTCIRCGHPLRLHDGDEFSDERPVPIPGKGELCPECYSNLNIQEYRGYLYDGGRLGS